MPTDKLVEYLSSLVDLQDMERWKVEELGRMLDPGFPSGSVFTDLGL